MTNHWRHVWMLSVILSCLFLDLGSKYWVCGHLECGERQVFIPGLLNLLLTSNTGFAFSIGQGHLLITKGITIAVFLVLLIAYSRRYWWRQTGLSRLETLGMSIIIGSALGNLLERLYYGKVTDFLEFAFINFPVFNIADVLIDTGIGLILISMYCCRKAPSTAT